MLIVKMVKILMIKSEIIVKVPAHPQIILMTIQ